MRQRTTDDTMKEVVKKTDPFGVVHERGFGTCRDLSARRNHISVDWRLQRINERARLRQMVELTIDGRTATVSYQELQKLLRHA